MTISEVGGERSDRTAARQRCDGPIAPILRKLRPVDQAEIEAHLMRLAPSDRRMRFCGTASDEAALAYCRNIDWSDTIMLGCFKGGHLRGLAELKVDGDHAFASAELAITVEPAFQNQGIGTELVRKMLAIARNRFLRKICMICLLDNYKMQHVASKLEADLTYREGEAEACILPSVPTYFSLFEEVSMDGQAFWRALLEPSAAMPPAT